MPIPAEMTELKPGHYTVDATGFSFYACNCSSQPANKTLRHINSNREHFSPFPPKPATGPAPTVTNVSVTREPKEEVGG